MNNIKKSLKASNGITLIALVITIIVLLILAGISISMLSGDNSILQKATDAKTYTERASVIEQAQTDVLGYQAENKGGDLEKSQLKTVLDRYFKDVPDELPDGDNLLNLELNTLDKYGKHTITISEIYKGAISNENQLSDLERLKQYFGNNNNFDDGDFLDNDELGIKGNDLSFIADRYSGKDELYYNYYEYKEKIFRVTWDDDNEIWTGEVITAKITGSKGLCKLDDSIDIFIIDGNIYNSDNYSTQNDDNFGTVYVCRVYDDDDNYLGVAYYTEGGDPVITSIFSVNYGSTYNIENYDWSDYINGYLKNEELEYISQDTSIVTINANGDITGTAYNGGNTTITITGKTTGKKIIIPVRCYGEVH